MKDQDLIKIIGKNIRQLRKEKGMKQIDLAYNCGFEKQNMQRLESGKTNPTIKTLSKIAEALGVTVIDLLK
jgi:transcriptional regulator with XRE-family HTH domain